MPFIFKPRQTTRLHLTSGDQELSILIIDLPSTTLFELAQLYQTSSKHPTSGDKIPIPAHFVREIIEAIVQNTVDWEGVENPAGAPVPFSAEALRTVLESDVSFIPHLINHIVDLFTRSRQEQRRLEDEEKNSPTSSPSPSVPASTDAAQPTAEQKAGKTAPPAPSHAAPAVSASPPSPSSRPSTKAPGLTSPASSPPSPATSPHSSA